MITYVLRFSAAYDPLDPTGNITIKWDVMSWTPDGYVVSNVLLATNTRFKILETFRSLSLIKREHNTF